MELNKDKIYYALIVLIVCLCVYLLYYINTNGYKCINNPLVYGVSRYSTNDPSGFTCTCSASNVNGYIYVTKKNVTYISFTNLSVSNLSMPTIPLI